MNPILWRCSACGYENIVDFDSLPIRPIGKLYRVRGFFCRGCDRWEAILFTSASLDEAMHKLLRYPPGHPKFQYMMAKCIKKVESLRQLCGDADGAFQHQNLALSG